MTGLDQFESDERRYAMIANSFTGTRTIGKLRLLLLAAMAAVILFDAAAAWACPANYVACGERKQLCCPKR
jgi:hypothetical protein